MNQIQEAKTSLWNQLETKQITKEQLQPALFKKLGEPSNELQQNLAQELIKKIVSYYFAEAIPQNTTIYSVVGYVAEINQRTRKKGAKKGQIFYDLVLGTKEVLKAYAEDLAPEQWSQISKLALLGQNLVFQYKKWFSNKQILGWYPVAKKVKN